jgi:hypothetical protein
MLQASPTRSQRSPATRPHHPSGGAATLEHHKANPGPVIADNLGEPASKEELKKRSDELNKK